LLEVMAERQVTVDAVPYLVPRPFIVIATQNPVEHGGTYDLPEAQLDRFMMRTPIGYPEHDAEVEVVANGSQGRTPEQLQPVMTTMDMQNMAQIASQVHLAQAIISYIVTIAAATRSLPELRLGISPRGSLALAQACQAYAAAQARPFVTPDDVKAMVPYVFGHRAILRPEAELQGRTNHDLLQSILASVPVPQRRSGG
jgi:MoxR-like ATPase